MNITEIFLIALLLIFTVPWLFWRLIGHDALVPLVVVQIVTGVLLGPGVAPRLALLRELVGKTG